MHKRSRPASLALLLFAALTAIQQAAAQTRRDCGGAGQACCCAGSDWQGPRCCGTGLQCTLFGGRGFGIPANITNLCLPQEPKACGNEGGRCCLTTSRSGYISGTCKEGLTCTPGSTVFGSRAQYDKLSGGIAAAAQDSSVAGTCKKDTKCNTANNPCGKAAGCSSAACPSGFYCASSFDSGVGDACIPLPANAGKAGGPCMPNNLPGSPLVKADGYGGQVAAPYCSGNAVCFTPTASGDASAFNLNRGAEAKNLATRILGTKCVEVPSDCGGVGKRCCPSLTSMVTDKALPTAAWGGSVCNPAAGPHGAYCDGSYAALAGQPWGKCVANPACGGPGQPCCKYSKVNMAGMNCPNLGRPGAGYCNIDNKCTLCPKVAYLVEDILRCY